MKSNVAAYSDVNANHSIIMVLNDWHLMSLQSNLVATFDFTTSFTLVLEGLTLFLQLGIDVPFFVIASSKSSLWPACLNLHCTLCTVHTVIEVLISKLTGLLHY